MYVLVWEVSCIFLHNLPALMSKFPGASLPWVTLWPGKHASLSKTTLKRQMMRAAPLQFLSNLFSDNFNSKLVSHSSKTQQEELGFHHLIVKVNIFQQIAVSSP
jgi:hypothetical protein